MKSVKYVLHNDDNEGHDDDDTDQKKNCFWDFCVSSSILFVFKLEHTYFLNMFYMFFEKLLKKALYLDHVRAPVLV
jgi:hypothetical protein